jgi:hypothetical protein
MQNYFEKPKYPKELEEISEKIADGQPAINWDDIIDLHFALKKYNDRVRRANARKRNDTKYRRVSL